MPVTSDETQVKIELKDLNIISVKFQGRISNHTYCSLHFFNTGNLLHTCTRVKCRTENGATESCWHPVVVHPTEGSWGGVWGNRGEFGTMGHGVHTWHACIWNWSWEISDIMFLIRFGFRGQTVVEIPELQYYCHIHVCMYVYRYWWNLRLECWWEKLTLFQKRGFQV